MPPKKAAESKSGEAKAKSKPLSKSASSKSLGKKKTKDLSKSVTFRSIGAESEASEAPPAEAPAPAPAEPKAPKPRASKVRPAEAAPVPVPAPEPAPAVVVTRPPADDRHAYRGPRPDEELLDAVREEARLGDEASIERVYTLIRNDEDVNQRDEFGFTPLAVAAAAGNGPLVSILLERAGDVTMRSLQRAELPLHHAARRGNRIATQLLCEHTAAAGLIDAENITGWRPLHLASLGGHSQVAVTLLWHRADINSRNTMTGSLTVLHGAVRLGRTETAESLLDRDAEVDALDVCGRGALHFAAARADLASVSLLLRYRADPMRIGYNGQQPLDLVPDFHPMREKVTLLLKAYMRPPPGPPRADARFDIRDDRELETF